jgi:hypothetical protein
MDTLLKKVIDFLVPRRDVTNQTLPDREYFIILGHGLVSDIPAADWKIVNLFYSVSTSIGSVLQRTRSHTYQLL